MPELPEVETIVREMREQLVGRTIDKVKVNLNKIARPGPRILARRLEGKRIEAAGRRGKFIELTLSGEIYLIVHLKMTGQFLWGEMPGPWPKHVHVAIGFTDGQAVMYRDMRQFGYLMALEAKEREAWWVKVNLGPDALEVSRDEFLGRLKGRRGRIKALLLNQSFIAGLGNIYADEALFASGLCPKRPAESIGEDEAERLLKAIRAILKEAVRRRGSTTNNYVGLSGIGGEYQNKHQVYGRAGQTCPVCGETLVREVVAGRGTHYCLCCQPEAGC